MELFRFIEQPDVKLQEMEGMEYKWKVLDDLIDDFNDYRASSYSSYDRKCVDKSISR